jgi:organic radical activating enzyme
LTVISGGEPFEHPQIFEILRRLSNQSNYFRIATGGFIDLTPWIDILKSLSYKKGTLQGISMGTDVLSTRVRHSRWVPTWRKNISLFHPHVHDSACPGGIRRPYIWEQPK